LIERGSGRYGGAAAAAAERRRRAGQWDISTTPIGGLAARQRNHTIAISPPTLLLVGVLLE